MTEIEKPDTEVADRLRELLNEHANPGSAWLFASTAVRNFHSMAHCLEMIRDHGDDGEVACEAINAAVDAHRGIGATMSDIKPVLAAYGAAKEAERRLRDATPEQTQEIASEILMDIEIGLKLGVLSVDRRQVCDAIEAEMIASGLTDQEARSVNISMLSTMYGMQNAVEHREDLRKFIDAVEGAVLHSKKLPKIMKNRDLSQKLKDVHEATRYIMNAAINRKIRGERHVSEAEIVEIANQSLKKIERAMI